MCSGPSRDPRRCAEKLDDVIPKAARAPEFVNVMNRMCRAVVYMSRVKVNDREEFPKVREIMKILRAEEAKVKE